jgi:PAS domain S-box-containing protein
MAQIPSNHLKAITESTTDAIISTDSSGNVISWNRAAEIIFQYSAIEMIGRPLLDIIPERFRSAHEKGMARVAAGYPPKVIGSVVELFGLNKSGEEFPIELSLSTWTTDEEKYYGGIIRDITQRKLIESKLRESEERFRSVMEMANDAIITADSKGDILSWNLFAQKIFGYTSEEVIGRSLSLIVPKQYRESHERGLERVAGGGPHHVIGKTVELLGLHKNGHHFPIELSLSTWHTGSQIFFCGIIRDISERKKQEEKIRIQQEELKAKTDEMISLNEEVNIKNEQLQALSNKLAKYLSRQVYTSIFEGKKDVKIESYRKKLTIFFSDIQGFTELTEKVESEVLTSVLNKYLNEMSKIALDHGGTIDKYIGDAIMIFFGDPETMGEKQDALACLKMAIAMKEKLIDLRREWDILGISTPLRVRMGINTGYCTVGNFGSEDRLDYTIVGGPVNAASRLESAAPIDEILISSDTYALVKEEVVCENFGEIEAKGIAYPIQTFLVKNLVSNIKREEEELIAQLKGFNLSINFHEMEYSDKLYARELLEKAINKL